MLERKKRDRGETTSVHFSEVQTPVIALGLVLALQVDALRSRENREEHLARYVLRVLLLEGLGDLPVLY